VSALHDFTASMTAALEEALAPVLARGQPVALANFPNHNNPGDNAIWLGTKAILRRMDVPIAYTCSPTTFDEATMRAAVGSGPLLLNGGGNFGDVYRGQQDLREHVLEHCTDRHVVQLPQSIWFRDPEKAQRMGRLCRSHPAFTLFVREQISAAFANDVLGVQPRFAPDLALALGPLHSDAEPRVPILWLGRDDPERVERTAPPPEIRFVDWVQGPPDAGFTDAERELFAENVRLRHAVSAGGTAVKAAVAATFDGLAHAWLRRGLDILASARVVITDRLHAHELAILLGIPHVVLDNANGKVRAVFEAWSGRSALAHWAETTDEAVAAARVLFEAAGSGRPGGEGTGAVPGLA
jgi:pyruvyl transferase EpsO